MRRCRVNDENVCVLTMEMSCFLTTLSTWAATNFPSQCLVGSSGRFLSSTRVTRESGIPNILQLAYSSCCLVSPRPCAFPEGKRWMTKTRGRNKKQVTGAHQWRDRGGGSPQRLAGSIVVKGTKEREWRSQKKKQGTGEESRRCYSDCRAEEHAFIVRMCHDKEDVCIRWWRGRRWWLLSWRCARFPWLLLELLKEISSPTRVLDQIDLHWKQSHWHNNNAH